MSPLDLIGRVAAHRLSDIVKGVSGRAYFCMVGLDADVVCAVSNHVARLSLADGCVAVFVHPEVASFDIGAATASPRTAPWHRNHTKVGTRLTLCTVAPSQEKATIPTLEHKDKIDDAWLLQDAKIWAHEGLPLSGDDLRAGFAAALEGLLQAGVAHDAVTVARFVQAVADDVVDKGLQPEKAIRRALPQLQLPRDAGDPRLKVTESAEISAQFFRKVIAEAQPSLYLKSRDGDPLNRSELNHRLKVFEDDHALNGVTVAAIRALLNDRSIFDGHWRETQQVVAELGWEAIEPFFSDAKRKAKPAFGTETREFFERQFPTTLTDDEEQLLDDLAKESVKPSVQIDTFFSDHRDRLKSAPKLFKRWERLVFRSPIETADLAEGLLKLADRAAPEADETDEDGRERVLVVRLRDGEKMDFWTQDKNTRVLRYLRDRYRGLRDLLAPQVRLEFGRCWDEDWEAYLEEENPSKNKDSVELEFEAFLVARDEVEKVLAHLGGRPHPNRAQLTWRPPAEALGLSFCDDLRRLRPEEPQDATRLVTGRVQQNQSARSASADGVDLSQRSSVTDAFGGAAGHLANPGRLENRIDRNWLTSLDAIRASGILTTSDADALKAAYEDFCRAYGAALQNFLRSKGVGSPELFEQAEAFGRLIRLLQTRARQDVSIRELLTPLVALGVIAVEGERKVAIIAAWQPLRLAEIGAKAHQLAEALRTIVDCSPAQRADISDFVADRVMVLKATYYADVAVTPGADELLAETETLADYSLVEAKTPEGHHALSEEPADAAVAAFDRVADEYLTLRPHERANFSVLVLDADSENLPLAMANGLSRRIEEDADLRCELAITDDDPKRLRLLYERQNRRIGHQIDASLASEAARNFLSRLRLGILTPDALAQDAEVKLSDVVILQDVIARHSKIRWTSAPADDAPPDLRAFVPTARSKRRPFRKGDASSALFLTAPRQPDACQAYVEALDSILSREMTTVGVRRLPVQEVDFAYGRVAQVLARAHALGHWVMTFDRVADRRLITRDARRIIRYFSMPGSTHNVIVSTEITVKDLADCISDGLDVILNSAPPAALESVREQLFQRAARLSGDIVMRAAQWRNYAKELFGVVLSQCEIERLLEGQDHCTGWFFLDDFRDWLDLSGEMADILAIDFQVGASGPQIRLVVAEAKYCDQSNLLDHRRKSLRQLENTFTTLHHRLLDPSASLDSGIWRHRLADMVLEHMEPFDQVGGLGQDVWLEGLRSGDFPIRLEGHSIVFSPELTDPGDLSLTLPDQDKPLAERRRLAQWIFPRATTAQALKDLADPTARQLLSQPSGWPAGDQLPPPPAASFSDVPPPPSMPDPAPMGTKATPAEEDAPVGDDTRAVEPTPEGLAEVVAEVGPWSRPISQVLTRLSRAQDEVEGEAWLTRQRNELRNALQTEGMDAPMLGSRLTPNTGLIYVGGRSLTVGWLERKQTDLLTRYGLDIVRITPMPGQIAVGLRRPTRAILHLADAWLRRSGQDQRDAQQMAPLLGEKEDDGALCFLPLANDFAGQDTAAPHSLISGTTGSGKGILVTNLMLDLCALNAPKDLELYLIDPKRGVDYAWARRLPHLQTGIIDDQAEAQALLARLVDDMDERYEAIAAEGCRNIDHYNRKVSEARRMPRVVIFFDEVANWMQDDEFKGVVDGLINKIATKSRAAGFHLFMIYQRADNQVMTMQLRTNLGNKLILRLGDEGSSKIALNEKGAERLLGKGHLIGKLGTDEKIYLQVPYIGDDEVEDLAEAIIATWGSGRVQS